MVPVIRAFLLLCAAGADLLAQTEAISPVAWSPTRAVAGPLTNPPANTNSPTRTQVSASRWSADLSGRFDAQMVGGQFGGSFAVVAREGNPPRKGLLISAQGMRDREGAAFFFPGTVKGLAETPAWSAQGREARAFFGRAVASGDFNGDGRSDLVVTASHSPGDRITAGRVAVYSGTQDGFREEADWEFPGMDREGILGMAVAVGDLNGDGFDDLAVGAPRETRSLARQGVVHVWFGSPTGLKKTPDWSAAGESSNANFGRAVAIPGDVNGDGLADLLVGAPLQELGALAGAGKAFAFYGSRAGLPSMADWMAEGVEAFGNFGMAIGPAGDVNGDGLADFIIGAPADERRPDTKGSAIIFRGAVGGPGRKPALILGCDQPGARFGLAVGAAGDINRDGFSDVLVGAPSHSDRFREEGRAYLHLGSRDGLEANAAWLIDGGIQTALLGSAVGGVGDVNGDGVDDFVIGSPGMDGRNRREGRLDVFFGSPQRFSRENLRVAIPPKVSPPDLEASSSSSGGATRSNGILPTVVVGLLVVVSGAAWLIWRHRRRLREERSRLARDLHDGFGSGLHRMQRMVEVLQRADPQSAEAARYRNEIIATAQELEGSLDRAIWAIKPENDTLEHLVNYLIDYARCLLPPLGVACEVEAPPHLAARQLAGDIREQVVLACNEILTNIVRHAGARNAWVRIRWQEPWLEIEIEDDGKGMDLDKQTRTGGGSGLNNLRQRVERLQGELYITGRPSGSGTIVRLKTPIRA
jgi:signal transduction histidine kinase